MNATAITAPATGRDLLVRALKLDALGSGTMGAALLVLPTVLDGVLGVSAAFLAALGAFLVVYALALVVLARAGAPTRAAVAVIAGNCAWIVASVLTVASDWLTLTTVGNVVTLAQAAAVVLFVALQLKGITQRT